MVVADAGRRGGPGVRIGVAGGYTDQRLDLTPGRSYRLAVWAGVSAAGDTGEVGITYLDAGGNRLVSDGSQRLRFDDTTPARQTLTFIPPADAVTVLVYAWKRPGPSEFIVDDVSVRELVVTLTAVPDESRG